MNPQIQKVTYFIENHLDDELDVMTLAKVAGYSHFHFCRIFKIHIGESAISYATRLKLERAASEMISGKKSMLEIALDAGYKTPTGFLKAFKTRFGTTPTAYKQSTQKELYKYKESMMDKTTIVEREEVQVVFTRELGNYMKSSELAWEKLSGQMNGLEKLFSQKPPSIEMKLGEGNAEALGICHDDPQITNEKNLRYDAALVWTEAEVQELAKYGFETKSVSGGKYAVLSYKGDYEVSEKAWYSIYTWVEKNGYIFRDEPAFEKYIDAWSEKDPTKIQTEIYVPLV